MTERGPESWIQDVIRSVVVRYLVVLVSARAQQDRWVWVRRRDHLQSHQVPPHYGCDDHDLAMRNVRGRPSRIRKRVDGNGGAPSEPLSFRAIRGILIVRQRALYRDDEDPSPDGSG